MANNNTKSVGAALPAGSPPVQPAGGSVPAASAGNGSNPAGNSGSGSITVIAPSSGQVPPAATLPGSGFRKEIAAVVAGIEKQFLDSTTLVVNGQSATKSSLLASFGNVESLYASVDTVAQQLKSQRLALKAVLPAAHQLLVGLKAALIGIFGRGNPVLESFGFSGKPRQLTAEQKLARKEKAKATRVQRGTSGKRQKAQNKFTGTVQIQTSVSGLPTAGGNTPAAGGNTSAPAPAVGGSPASGPATDASKS